MQFQQEQVAMSSSIPPGNKEHLMKQPPIHRLRPPSPSHLSITARHSFLQVKRLPLRSRKVAGAAVRGGVCLHSISSRGMGAGRMLRVAPGAGREAELSDWSVMNGRQNIWEEERRPQQAAGVCVFVVLEATELSVHV